jgi:hypothetical protein
MDVRFTGAMTTPIPEGVEISIFHAVSGGEVGNRGQSVAARL